MPLLPHDTPAPVPGDPISAGDIRALGRSAKFIMNYVADNARENPGSQRKRNQNPLIQRLGTITKIEISPGQADNYPGQTVTYSGGSDFVDYPDARYYVSISSPRLNLKPDGTAANQTPDLLATNPSPEINSSFITEIVTATNLAELPTDPNGDPGKPYPNGMGTHTITQGTRVWLWGVPVEWDPTILRWVFFTCPPTAWIKLTSAATGGGFYNARLLTGSPQTIDPTTNLVIPFSPNETIPSTDNILAENCLEANLGAPPSHWCTPLPMFVPAWPIGASNESTPRPAYRFALPPPPGPAVALITSPQGYAGKYNGTIYLPPTTDDGTGDLTMPDGMTAGASCLIINVEEDSGTPGAGTASATNRLATGSYVVGTYGGMSAETPPRPTIIVRGGYGINTSPQFLPHGSYGSPNTQTWNRQSSATYNGVPVQFDACWIGWDSSSGTLFSMTRTPVYDARGVLFSVSGEVQAVIDTSTACAS